MIPLIVRFPLDKTGHSPNNLVLNDVYVMAPRARRIIVPRYGGFFADSLTVIDNVTQKVLSRGVHYSILELNPEATLRLGKEVSQLIAITDTSIGDTVYLNYQAVGGEYTSIISAVEHLLGTTDGDTRPVYWTDISDHPSTFAATWHLHDVGDIYDFNAAAHKVDRIRAALEMKDIVSHDAIYHQIDQVSGQFSGDIAALVTGINNHINNHLNPHNTTAAQINAYTRNQVLATLNNIVNNLNYIIGQSEQGLNGHLVGYNPHIDTAGGIGAYTGAEQEAMIQAMLAAQSGGTNGTWQYLYEQWTYSATLTNELNTSAFYSITSAGQDTGREANRIYVNGALISDAFNYHTNDYKLIQGVIMVPAGGSLTIDCNTGQGPCRLKIWRFKPI